MKTLGVALAFLLTLYVDSIGCADDEVTECGSGTACFSDGQLPDWVTPASTAYYCCLQRNMTERGNRLPDGSYNCSCVLDLTLPARIEAWALATRHQGRMCVRDDCQGSAVTTTVSERYHYCCYVKDSANVTSAVTWIDADKEEFIGCRCLNQSVPTPDPQDYVVPPVMMDYNSTGEVCFYDNACQDRPALKCQSHGVTDVTFCCYGSRGLVTQNDAGGSFTRCTCSDEVYGAQCEPRPIAIAQTTLPCLTACNDTAADDKCVDSSNAERCCAHNMAVMAGQSAGTFTSCTCKAQATKTCDTTLTTAACLTDCDDVAEEDKCVDSSKAERCCPFNMAVLADQSEGNFTSCTCKARATRNCDINPTSSAVHLGGRFSNVMLLVWTLLYTAHIGL